MAPLVDYNPEWFDYAHHSILPDHFVGTYFREQILSLSTPKRSLVYQIAS